MATDSVRVFSEPSGRVYGRIPSAAGIVVGITGIVLLFAPLRWPGSSPAWSVLGVALIAGAVALLRWAHKLGKVGVEAGPSGIRIVWPRHADQLSWEQIRAFTPGWLTNQVPVVVVELLDGQRIKLEQLRVDYGPLRTKAAEARVRQLCDQLERCRPRPPAQVAQSGEPASALAHPSAAPLEESAR